MYPRENFWCDTAKVGQILLWLCFSEIYSFRNQIRIPYSSLCRGKNMPKKYKLHDPNLPYIWQQKSQMINAHLEALAPAHLQLSILRWLLQDMEGRYRNTSLVKWDSAAPRVILEGASIGAVVTSCWNRKTKSYSINSTSISVCLDNHSIAYFEG